MLLGGCRVYQGFLDSVLSGIHEDSCTAVELGASSLQTNGPGGALQLKHIEKKLDYKTHIYTF